MHKFRVAEHKTIHVDGKDFLFLVADKAIFEMDPSTKGILADWGSKRDMTRKEALASLGALCAEDRDALFQGLLQRRVLIPARGTAPHAKTVGACPVSIPLKTLILHLTDTCNLSCRYCYYAERGRSTGRKERMDLNVARQAVDFLVAQSGGLEEVVLVFFGGEPLLNFKAIPAVVDYACAKAAATGKKVNFALTTNGTLLTEEIVDFFQQKNIGVTVSMDGFQEVHDSCRRFPDGSPSYALILPKVKHLLQQARQRPVAARVTLVKDPGQVPLILDHLLGLGFMEVGFAPVTTGHPDYQLRPADMDRLLEAFQDLAQDFLQAAQEGRFLGFSNLIDLLVALHQGEVLNYPCGAGLGLFAVDPGGRLFLCQRFTGDEQFCMGDIFRGLNQEKLAEFRAEAAISNKTDCQQCWARTLCTGGCYHEACVREGSHLKPNLHYCDWIRRWGEIGLEAYCQIAATYPDYLERLCRSRGYRP
ncbi:MAG: quinohemoprotein amine dehydrogenase maturation protein [Desulfobacterales bacterium]|nr:MAG: quinohemoprotein amine dehydrogenase maturation protein [Desulfobacterales bacterium]